MAPVVVLKVSIDLYAAFAKGIGVDLTNGFYSAPPLLVGKLLIKLFHTTQQILASRLIWMKAVLPQQEHSTALDRAAPSLSPLQARTCRVSWDTLVSAVSLPPLATCSCPLILPLTLTGQEVNIVDLGDLYQNCNTLRNFLPASFPR